jgi:predicted amidophosphoribosyltransferase
MNSKTQSSILKLFATNNNTCEECDKDIKGTYKLCYQCNQKRQQRLKKYREEEAEEQEREKKYIPVCFGSFHIMILILKI